MLVYNELKIEAACVIIFKMISFFFRQEVHDMQLVGSEGAMWCRVVWYKECQCSAFRWWHQVSPKRRYLFTSLYSATFQKTVPLSYFFRCKIFCTFCTSYRCVKVRLTYVSQHSDDRAVSFSHVTAWRTRGLHRPLEYCVLWLVDWWFLPNPVPRSTKQWRIFGRFLDCNVTVTVTVTVNVNAVTLIFSFSTNKCTFYFRISVQFTLHMFRPWLCHHHGTSISSLHCSLSIRYHHNRYTVWGYLFILTVSGIQSLFTYFFLEMSRCIQCWSCVRSVTYSTMYCEYRALCWWELLELLTLLAIGFVCLLRGTDWVFVF